MNKSWFLAASAWQQIFGLHSRLAIQQWSLAPDTKIYAASLPNSQLFNSFVYMPKELFEATYPNKRKSCFLRLFRPIFLPLLGLLKTSMPCEEAEKSNEKPIKNQRFRLLG